MGMRLPPELAARAQIAPDGTPFFGAPQAGDAPIARFATDPALEDLLQALAAGFGRRRWWPARSPFEVLVGAILVQNTAWANVERALANLRALDEVQPDDPLTPAGLLALAREPEPAAFAPHDPTTHTLEALVRPSGAFRQKAKKLACASEWLLSVGGWEVVASAPLEELRPDLLGVFGIGPETADSILAYAAGRPLMVVDAYARRVLTRHGLVPEGLTYDALQAWLHARLLPDPLVLEEAHALFVAAGAAHCKPKARCLACPAPTPDTLA